MIALSLTLLSLVQNPVLPDWGISFDHTTTSNNGGAYPDYPSVLVAGASDSTFIAGQYAFNGSNAVGWFVEKVDRDGQAVWTQDSGVSFTNDYRRITDAVADGSGGVVCVGTRSYRLQLQGGDDIFILHFNGDGNLLWESSIGDAASELAGTGLVRERASSIATDGVGGYWIGGESYASTATSTVYGGSLFRVDSGGQEVARFSFPTTLGLGGVSVLDLEPDGSGGVYCSIPQGYPIFSTRQSVLHVGPAGTVLWQTEFDAPIVINNSPIHELTLTSDGGIVAAGPRALAFINGVTMQASSQLVKMDAASGDVLWSRVLAFDVRSGVSDLAPSDDGGLYVTGGQSSTTNAGAFGEGYVARLDASGQLLWQHTIDPADTGISGATAGGYLTIGGNVRVDRFGILVAGMTAALPTPTDWKSYMVRYYEPVGEPYCEPSVPNSTGNSAKLFAEGSDIASDNKLLLSVSGMPPMSTSLLLNSPTQGLFPAIGGGQGTLCMGGPFGRYINQTQSSSGSGRTSFLLDLTVTPTPMGIVSVMTGEVWNFQVWYRDANPTATSNLSNAVTITFM